MKSNSITAIETAKSIVESLSNDPAAFGDGRRNDDCVDICIAYHVLGVSDDDMKAKVLACHKRLSENPDGYAAIRVRNKINQIVWYLDSWGPVGKEEQALSKLCRSKAEYKSGSIE